MAKEWFYKMMGDELGPISSGELKTLVEKGQVVHDTKIRLGAGGKWHSAEKVKGLFAAESIEPKPVETPPSSNDLTADDLIWDDSDDFI